jgi:hypothetical protein
VPNLLDIFTLGMQEIMNLRMTHILYTPGMLGDIASLFIRFSNGVLSPPHEHYYDIPE